MPGPQSREGRTGRWFGLFAVVLVVATLLAYQPAWQGGFVWDDEAHVTAPQLRSLHGLWRIWFELDATQQYYPLLHSAFWVQYRLWGDWAPGYHLVNILLHAAAAVMVALALRRLEVPGAYLAAAVFALHPVHVESVAWITELKNTLSGVFYLGAALAYLRFDRTRRKGAYALAAGLFVMGLLSKTVAATLPAALLVVFWWKRGRLGWKRDVLPLIPLFVVGAGTGLFIAWVERTVIGAEGEEFGLRFTERFLLAGRMTWFYLGKLFWPANLMFVYPRWHVSQAAWWQWLFPAGFVAMLAALWAVRHRSRAPLAAMLFFVGTLFPVLGFFNLYLFRYTFVADHFQYLPSVGILALVAGAIAWLRKRAGPRWRIACLAGAVALPAALGILTWRQSRLYRDVVTLFQDTVARNEECWMGRVVLGVALEGRGREEEAIDQYHRALRARPRCKEAHNNLGRILAARGEFREASEHLDEALRIDPDFVGAQNTLAYVWMKQGRLDEAIELFGRVLSAKPDLTEAHQNLGCCLGAKGKLARAVKHFRQAVKLNPNDPGALETLRDALAAEQKLDEAIGRLRQGLLTAPDDTQARCELARALEAKDRPDLAAEQYRHVLRLNGDHLEACNRLAWLLATEPSLAGGDPAEAVAWAQRACRLTGDARADFLDTLAAAYAHHGMFPQAVQTAQRAIEAAKASAPAQRAEEIQRRLELYRAGKCYRVPAP